MNEKFKAIDSIISPFDLKGDTIQEQFKDLYELIGKYFISNADRMSKDICMNNKSLNISIDVVPGKIITIDRKTSELLLRVKEDNR